MANYKKRNILQLEQRVKDIYKNDKNDPELYIAIRANGDLIFRKWDWSEDRIRYLYTYEKPDKFIPTQAQCETVNGLWSGRIKFEGLKLDVGETVQDICPINVEQEGQLLDKKIGFA